MEILKEKQKTSLTNNDLYKIIGKVKIIRYPDFATYDSIFQCFGGSNKFVIFFETESNDVGHWECCFLDRQHKIIHFFDSYGLPPDAAEEYLNKNLEFKLKENKPLLYKMFADAEKSGFTCLYSSFRYQEMKNDISTCGRWCAIRLKNMKLSDDEFHSKMTNLKLKWHYPTYDDVVTKLTEKF